MCSYCLLRIDIGHLENMFKCSFRWFAYNRSLWEFDAWVRICNVAAYVEDFSGFGIDRRFSFGVGVQSLERYDCFKAVL